MANHEEGCVLPKYALASLRSWAHSNMLQRLCVFVHVLVGTVPRRTHQLLLNVRKASAPLNLIRESRSRFNPLDVRRFIPATTFKSCVVYMCPLTLCGYSLPMYNRNKGYLYLPHHAMARNNHDI